MHTEAQQTRLHSGLYKMISKDLFEQCPSKCECTLDSQYGPRLHCIHSVGCVMRQNLPSPTPPWELQSVFVDRFFIVQILSHVSSRESLEPSKLTGSDVGGWVDMRMLYPEPGRPLLHFPAPFPGFWCLCFYQMLPLAAGATVPNSSESWKCCRKGDPTSRA